MINVVRMSLDLSKPPESEGRVVVRQGESLATTLVVEVSLDGDPFDLSGWEAFACFRLPGGTYVEDSAAVEGSTATYVMSAATCQTPGLSRECCLALRQDGSCVTTGSFALLVLPDPCEGDGGVAQAYVSRVEELMGRFRDEFDEAEAIREQRVSAAVTEASDAASRANEAADLVHQAIQGDLEPVFGEYLEGKKDVPGGIVSLERHLADAEAHEEETVALTASIMRDVAILRFDASLSAIVADQEMRYVKVWEFPDDAVLVEGYYDASSNSYYCEVNAQ